MLKNKFDGNKKLINLSFEQFNNYRNSAEPSIIAQEARLIPLLKTGDEGALTSIFLSSVRLIKEYRDTIFKELKLSRSGTPYYFTEVTFKDKNKDCRFDGLILIVSKGVIKEAAVFEMKNKTNGIVPAQIEKYIALCKDLGINSIVTVSNEFVSDVSQSPISVKLPKGLSMYHFSWTYLMTMGQLLLFKNEANIQDEDQVEIMKEVLHYLDDPQSGVSGYHSMKSGWKDAVDKISSRMPLKANDQCLIEAVESWHQEEKDMALMLSRKLGVMVKSTPRGKDSCKEDVSRIINHQELQGDLSVKNSVSDIKITLDMEVKSVAMSIKVVPPLDKGTKARISWLAKQLENAKKKSEEVFTKIENDLIIEANVKHAREHVRVKLSDLDTLLEEANGKEIQAFNVVLMSKFGAGFGSNKKFIVLLEQMILDYYAGIVQHMTNWNRPAPQL